MWKDFFYFSRAERRLLTLLLVLAAVLAVSLLAYRHYAPQSPDDAGDEALEAFRVSVEKADSLRRQGRRESHSHVSGKPAALFPFDPNTADSSQLTQLGLSDFVVRNILKYRARGGVFRTSESLAKIYGLSTEDYRRLLPYIRIRQDKPVNRTSTPLPLKPEFPAERPVTGRVQKYAEGTVIDLNDADTASLKRVPGIGRVRAARIVAYRRQLGGYYAVSQLAEIQGMPDSVARWFRVGRLPVKSLRVNRWDVDRLRRHPYLNFYQAKVIVEHRHKYGRLDSLPQLALYEEFTKKDLERLRYYVDFD